MSRPRGGPVTWVFAAAALVASCGPGTGGADAVTVVGEPSPTPVATTAPLEVPAVAVAANPGPVAAEAAALAPAVLPTATSAPTPTTTATSQPAPDDEPTAAPTAAPTPPVAPTAAPTAAPTTSPSPEATAGDSPAPTSSPEAAGTTSPSPEAIAGDSPGTSGPDPDPTPDSPPRTVVAAGHVTLGLAGSVTLVLPVVNVELIGFHEAGHPGSQAINAAASGLPITTLESRSRGTASTSAADIVMPPGEMVRAPVTGTVISSNVYTLYCDHVDQLVYIEPDGLPGWQVRIFHIQGATPPVGTRVVAGETQIAEAPRRLPFDSQVDEFTAEPSWPHIHVEVVDTNVPDTRPPGPGCP